MLVQALNSKFKDFEDAIQNYASVKSGAIDTRQSIHREYPVFAELYADRGRLCREYTACQ